jgi:cytochrome c oxidase subunit 2
MDRLVPSASSFSGDIDWLILFITFAVGIFFVLAEVMLFWLLFRYRARPDVPAQYVIGNEKHVKKWINYPHVAILAFDVFIVVAAIKVWVDVKQTLPPADRTIRVVSQQWAWTFTEPGADGQLDTADDIRTTDQLHLEAGKTYHFQLESRDVLHSFFIPAFRLKHDAVPGRVYTGWFRPTRPGNFDILCAEMCGIGHGVMGARLTVADAAGHAAWVAQHSPVAAIAEPAADTTSVPAAAGTP